MIQPSPFTIDVLQPGFSRLARSLVSSVAKSPSPETSGPKRARRWAGPAAGVSTIDRRAEIDSPVTCDDFEKKN